MKNVIKREQCKLACGLPNVNILSKVSKFKVLLYLKKSNLDKQGKASIMGRITLNRSNLFACQSKNSMAQFSCKLSCNPKLWNPRSGRLEGKGKEAVETNAKIERILLSVNSAVDNLTKRNVDFTATAVKEMMQGSVNGQVTLLQVFDILLEETKNRVGIDRTLATYRCIRQVKDSLADFISVTYGVSYMAFGQMTNQFINDYEHFLIDEQGKKATTAHKHFTNLKQACRRAYKDGLTDKYLFARYKEPTIQKKTPRTITPENFEKIVSLEIPSDKPSLIISRDLLLIACYTGMAYIDAVSVTQDNLSYDEQGNLWLKYNRKKTGVQAMVKLIPEAIALFDKYKDAGLPTLMPRQNYAFLLKNLKMIAEMAGCTQPIRTLMEMAAEELERIKIKSAATTSNGSIKLAKFKNKCLKEYLMSIGREDMSLADVTLQLGKDYHIYLRQKKHLCPATANDCLAWLSRLVFLAVDKEILRSNPLEDIEYEKVKRNVEIRYLTRKQVKMLLAHPFQQRQMELARHMLLFTVFTGLAYVDLIRLRPEHIQTDAKGRRFIRKCRQKTGVETFVPLHPIAEQILALYNTMDNSKPVFPLPPYANYRLYKEFVAIGIFLGLDRNLSHHDARHTNATLLVSAGVNMESVSKMMGHSSIKSTQKYAQITVNRISQEMDRLIERRKK